MSGPGVTNARRPARRDRGSILVETAMVVTFMMALIVGTFELGMGWRTSISNSNASRAGARVAAYQGQGYQADYAALIAAASGLASNSRATVTKVVIFKATSGSTTVPAACLAPNIVPATLSSRGGVSTGGVYCNVYSGAQVAGVAGGSITTTSFGNGSPPATGETTTTCTSSKLDSNWCPSTRANSQVTGLDLVGVYVEVQHATVSKLFGSAFTIKDSQIMQIEPSAAG